jgi:glutathione peroxidase-family protein
MTGSLYNIEPAPIDQERISLRQYRSKVRVIANTVDLYGLIPTDKAHFPARLA